MVESILPGTRGGSLIALRLITKKGDWSLMIL